MAGVCQQSHPFHDIDIHRPDINQGLDLTGVGTAPNGYERFVTEHRYGFDGNTFAPS
ncbi:hypothetical protein GCM10009789_11110 [Kribbella sancticallisti]|uniref:Uncharacterized protein n=1 Tax=Kribbella sancticallisti TaxID=460087 RepID=A0ABP4NFD8_9ACTN